MVGCTISSVTLCSHINVNMCFKLRLKLHYFCINIFESNNVILSNANATLTYSINLLVFKHKTLAFGVSSTKCSLNNLGCNRMYNMKKRDASIKRRKNYYLCFFEG